MRQNIARWYQESGIILSTPEQYDQRVETIEEFVKKQNEQTVYCAMVRCFMGMNYDKEQFEEFIQALNEKDISFSGENIKELALLAGIILVEKEDLRYAMMALLAYERGQKPFHVEIYQKLEKSIEECRLGVRANLSSSALSWKSQKNMTDDEKAEWETGANYISSFLAEQNKFNKQLAGIIDSIYDQMLTGDETANLLWWMVADWSEAYDQGLDKLDGKKAAIAIPFELMEYTENIPGPLAIRKIIKKALAGKDLETTFELKDYISAADSVVLDYGDVKNRDLSSTEGFTPILQLLQDKNRFPEDMTMVGKLFGEKYEMAILERSYSVCDFAYQLYLECELLELR